jgi:hypothetical protein
MTFQLYLHRFLLIQTLPGAMRCLDPVLVFFNRLDHLAPAGTACDNSIHE